MSEYTEVEQPFLPQLAALGWEIIDQGQDIPSDPGKSQRLNFRQWLLPELFARAVAALNTTSEGKIGSPLNSYRICRIKSCASPTAPCWRPQQNASYRWDHEG